MALVFEEKQKFNWRGAAIVAGILVVIAGAVYFLFFTPVPTIEVIISPDLRSATEISNAQFDPAGVVNNPDFRALRRYTGPSSVGQVGRPNPFIKF